MRFRHETDIMGCTSSMSRRNSEATSFRLILVGLDGAGKTSLLYKLSLGDFVTTKPTLGFNVETISYNNNTITLWDMGGTPSIRRLWKHYYLNCHGMIFVIDGSARDRLQDADDLLTSLLMEKELHGIPMVFLANKKDIEACPNGWITYNQNCYLVLTIQATWGAASSYCQAFRAKLAEPRTVQEAHFLSVMTYPVGGIYWIGVTDIAVEGDWIFASDSSYVNSSYWHSTEPSGKPLENCVVMRDTFMGYWDDVLCSTEAGFVCEKIDT
ncbi:ADP-ribosylation factor 5-like isoform X2 [Crassostrea angulata]|uniref:ADP-ribosylation factor 5-like isoform X2 n=1 Tax=Magallana angulata TaxID=2784310 RepID=UPI0022B1FE60|nr:ADP-ribosylation factor 5-like isoform X2 [Crassostrea angulata]